MHDIDIDRLRDILKHMRINEAFDLTLRYARSQRPVQNIDDLDKTQVEAVKFLREFVAT